MLNSQAKRYGLFLYGSQTKEIKSEILSNLRVFVKAKFLNGKLWSKDQIQKLSLRNRLHRSATKVQMDFSEKEAFVQWMQNLFRQTPAQCSGNITDVCTDRILPEVVARAGACFIKRFKKLLQDTINGHTGVKLNFRQMCVY